MSETNTLISESKPTSMATRIGWGILIVATLYVCYFSNLGAIGFVGPDEPRYAWIARDMVETGDWVTPRLYGKPWFEKPVLYYWGAAACFKLLGVSEAAARLPSAISALLATLALAWLALRFYGAETARWLLLLLPTSVGMIGFSHAAATDMPFSGMLTMAMVCAAVVLGLTRNEHTPILPRTPWIALLLFGFFLGLAVLAKGPAGILLSGGAIFFWAIFTKRWRDAFRLFHPVAIASFCATALPWYIQCARRNADFFRIFIIEHNFKRYLTPEFQHIQPFWYYAPILLAATLPWTILVLWSLITGSIRLLRNRRLSEQIIFFCSWILFCVVFFSVSKSKLPGYILPALPAIGMLFARTLVIGFDRVSLFLRLGGLTLTCFASIGLISGTLQSKVHALYPDEVVPFASVYLVSFVFGLIAFGCSLLQLRRSAVILLQIAVLVSLGTLQEKDLRLIDAEFSAHGALVVGSEAFHRVSIPNNCVYDVNRNLRYQLNFYLHKEIPDCGPSAVGFTELFTSHRSAPQFESLDFQCAKIPSSYAGTVCRRTTGGIR